MEGRWNVHLDINGDLHENVPVVPCDDAAIKRAAYALCCDPIVELFDGLSSGDTDRDYPKMIVEAILRAAGETPRSDPSSSGPSPSAPVSVSDGGGSGV